MIFIKPIILEYLTVFVMFLLFVTGCNTRYDLATMRCDQKKSQHEVSQCKEMKMLSRKGLIRNATENAKANFSFSKGIEKLERDQIFDAINDFKMAVDEEEKFIQGYLILGNTLYSAGNMTDALEVYDKVLVLNDRLASAHYFRGMILKDLHRYKESIDAFQNAVKYQPHMALAHYQLSQLLQDYLKDEESLDASEKAYEIWENNLEFNPMYFHDEPDLKKAYLQTKHYLVAMGRVKN
ncbi:MAG: tetratricopeptide repeat protein [Deltaproteobacteria bacterium]|nr:tetratricopeptide repeat protein [Deltaproteobacteria bacterium]